MSELNNKPAEVDSGMAASDLWNDFESNLSKFSEEAELKYKMSTESESLKKIKIC